ncbi:MAG: histidinol dehydrogenase [Candidatus Omnitrophica bacterium]|nr:histidinol dehydrogenase [Candidatus Omnitrophota bacterium]
MMQLITADAFTKQWASAARTYDVDPAVAKTVARILADVRKKGDRALVKYTRQFDGVALKPKRLRVAEGDINRAFNELNVSLIPLLKQVAERVRRFYRREAERTLKICSEDGVELEEISGPIERVGIYIPGGTRPLVSTVYMTVLPAQMAGVKEIALVSPPSARRDIDPHILAVANLLGVREIYRVGGAQAVAALAFGTRTIRKVDKIVGPGNPYVTEAKRQAYGYCAVDMVAGPSEIAVIADDDADPDWVAADLAAQGEHHMGRMFLITNSRRLALKVQRSLAGGTCVLTRSLNEAARIANRISPEHLEIMTKNPRRLLKEIRHAGAIFLGPFSPAVLGDYVAGPSHVLPTGGSARFYSSLGVEDFLKRSHVIGYTREALSRARGIVGQLTEMEGLPLHRRSVEVRFNKEGSNEEDKS